MSENIPVLRKDFYLKITDYTHIYNTLKPPNKIQNGRNKEFLGECGYLWFKIHNLTLSDQNEIKLYSNKRKLLCWNI